MTSIDHCRRFMANKSRFEPNIEENINVLIRLLVTVDLPLTVQSRATFTEIKPQFEELCLAS